MKRKTLFFTSILLLSFELVNGQKFVGGSIGFSASGGSMETGSVSVDKPTTTLFSFSPMGGYFLSDNIAVGASINFSTDRVKTPGNPVNVDVSKTFGLMPFIRYYVLRISKFSVFGQGYMGISWITEKSTTGNTTVDGPTITTSGFGLTPCISYDLNNKVSLEANINLLNLGYQVSVVKSNNGNGTETKDITSNFNFGAGLNDIVNTGSIVIGAIFKLP